jgi:hypothetical protein
LYIHTHKPLFALADRKYQVQQHTRVYTEIYIVQLSRLEPQQRGLVRVLLGYRLDIKPQQRGLAYSITVLYYTVNSHNTVTKDNTAATVRTVLEGTSFN